MDNAKNFAKVTVDGGYDDTATSINLIAADGAKLPTAPFNAVWWNTTDYPDPADDPNKEIVRVTAIATDTLTVTRAQEGTAALEHQLEGKLYRMAAGLTAKTINDLPFSWQGDLFRIIPGIGKEILIGDPDADYNGTMLRVDDSTGRILFYAGAGGVFIDGKLGVGSSAAASTLGTVVGKVAVYSDDALSNLIGYLPIYDSIT